MCRPLPTHAIGNDLMAHELWTHDTDLEPSLYKSEVLSKKSSASRSQRARAVLIENGIRSTPIT
jgi:hypothetical protein